MFSIALIYDESGKRYVLSQDILEHHIDKETLDIVASTGIYVGFDATLANVQVTVSYI